MASVVTVCIWCIDIHADKILLHAEKNKNECDTKRVEYPEVLYNSEDPISTVNTKLGTHQVCTTPLFSFFLPQALPLQEGSINNIHLLELLQRLNEMIYVK